MLENPNALLIDSGLRLWII